ncbi:hypothetical protein J6590_096016 [Homalodisca vitripennis]|nr:hypothetical protein J6590_041961 [Homalodisca vitripennis]KAG8274988.1 hypothetical protein J6590_096016 [Homalodisca vitripennis]
MAVTQETKSPTPPTGDPTLFISFDVIPSYILFQFSGSSNALPRFQILDHLIRDITWYTKADENSVRIRIRLPLSKLMFVKA